MNSTGYQERVVDFLLALAWSCTVKSFTQRWKVNALGCAAGVIHASAPPHLFTLYLLITVVKVWHDLEEADFGLITFSSRFHAH